GPAGRRGESELDLLAARLNDFSRERAAPEPSEPGLDCEVMDFGAVERLADRFGIEVLELPENLPSTVSLDGRSYPSCVIVTARSLLRAGDLIRFRESLDYFRSLAADTLKARVQEWLESR
ncbi:MAG: hypothetical protein HY549_09865, partial [Elusimicrobia bacterium]|nr:hypothetical protein [Elusimicrobiota bacterium]